MSEETGPGSCPCGSGRPYEECCGPCHEGKVWPDDPLTMVRSRYCAYARGKYQYLVDTYLASPENPGPTAEELAEGARGVRWQALRITGSGRSDEDNCDFVDFYAYYAMDDGLHQLGEHALFRRVEDRLYYTGGSRLAPAPYRHEGPRVGRNDPCPCGSGRKYKKCCGRTA